LREVYRFYLWILDGDDLWKYSLIYVIRDRSAEASQWKFEKYTVFYLNPWIYLFAFRHLERIYGPHRNKKDKSRMFFYLLRPLEASVWVAIQELSCHHRHWRDLCIFLHNWVLKSSWIYWNRVEIFGSLRIPSQKLIFFDRPVHKDGLFFSKLRKVF